VAHGTSWRQIGLAILISAAAIVALVAYLHVDYQRDRREWQRKRQELLTAVSRSESLLRALQAYRADYDVYPASLPQLLPGYLQAVPRPGPPFKGDWSYERGPGGSGDPRVFELYVVVPNNYDPLVRGWVHFDDCFAYRSDAQYPPAAHGGVLERIGDWGYYHE
jgi:hypothetical protein